MQIARGRSHDEKGREEAMHRSLEAVCVVLQTTPIIIFFLLLVVSYILKTEKIEKAERLITYKNNTCMQTVLLLFT